VMNGIINGKGDGTLNPQGTAARAETAQMIMNYFQK
ncbi:MAG: S-layer homology domain-containing protein, partial [Ruminiclostridium sp.]|nr:S-layer homology domain-containing protein [Ruminiclostridium sp.]